jgi:hypothetical protein
MMVDFGEIASNDAAKDPGQTFLKWGDNFTSLAYAPTRHAHNRWFFFLTTQPMVGEMASSDAR